MDLIKLNEIMQKIEYGWMDIHNDSHINSIEDYQKLYRVSSPDEVLKNKLGSCFDQVELERFLLEDEYNVESYAIVYGNRMIHSFVILNDGTNFIYYENSSFNSRGIYYYKNKTSAIEKALEEFIINHKVKNIKLLKLIKYKKLEPNTTFQELKELLLNSPNLLLDQNIKIEGFKK